ncbi:MAG: iron-containing alcohol dehydrogenase family protein [Anaerotignum sp.]|nr:iron-containing alcohol dehydrogenase family protein [Anaerotignum sp.]
MENLTVFYPGYYACADAYYEIEAVCSPYGTKAGVLSDEISINATNKYIDEATAEGTVKVDYVLFGGEASFEECERLEALDVVKDADMVFCLGGGKAIDVGKYVARDMGKPYFTFPTIASTCACNSALGIYYNEDHTFRCMYRVDRPPVHIFISTQVIAEAPVSFLWAGIGDGMSKEAEVTFSARGRENELTLEEQAGVALAACCTEPLLRYGVQAIEDCKNNVASEAIEQVALDIFINTGMVSNMVDSAKYNTSVAHAFFNASTTLHQIEARHKHGEVVSYGTLILLTLDKQYDKLDRFYDFYKAMKLPTKLADIEITVDELDPVLELAMKRYDMDVVPYEITAGMLKDAILELEEYNKKKEA